jgi:hypothetical protein
MLRARIFCDDIKKLELPEEHCRDDSTAISGHLYSKKEQVCHRHDYPASTSNSHRKLPNFAAGRRRAAEPIVDHKCKNAITA